MNYQDNDKTPLDPESVNDKEYIVADGDAKQARSYSDEARQIVRQAAGER